MPSTLTAAPSRVNGPALYAELKRATGRDGVLAFAPGRVNLIGDHIDYCGGTVLPMPIEQGTWVAAVPNDRGEVSAMSDNDPSGVRFPTDNPPDLAAGHWGRFVLGAWQLVGELQPDLTGVDIRLAGDIPTGGLSSSASLSLALLRALSTLAGIPLTTMQLALLGQRIEHEFIGVKCGLMDQAVIALGAPDAALCFDCAEQTGRNVPLSDAHVVFVIADSGVPRTLAGSAYNERLAELAAVASQLGLPSDDLARRLHSENGIDDPTLRARARHVRTEQQRVRSAVNALTNRDWPAFGELLIGSHTSLAVDYQVSCPELDCLVELFCRQPGCYGARMTGAGFGGAVVALVRADQADAISRAVATGYAGATGRPTSIFAARSTGGVRIVG